MPDWLAQSALGWAPRLLQSAWRRLTGWAERPRLVIGHRVERLPVFAVEVPQDAPTPLPPNAANPTGYRMADLAFITITNDADRPQSDALDVTARLWFDSENGEPLFSLPARRRDSLQVWQTGGDFMSIADRLPIPVGHTRELDVALKYTGDTVAYAHNTEAHAYSEWLKPEWRLPMAKYRVRAHISGRNFRTQKATFVLTVPGADDRLAFERSR